MRKVHYQVVLDVFTSEDDNASGMEILEEADFWPEHVNNDQIYGGGVDVLDVTIESIRVTDSR